jgi:DNA sulfur modification protein DndD
MGRNIKEAIERILGVPILTNGRAGLGELAKDAQKREAKAAQKNQKLNRYGLQEETDRLKKAKVDCATRN